MNRDTSSPVTRRSSVFVDLMTVFRKNTHANNQGRRSSRYHARPAHNIDKSSDYESDLEAFTSDKTKTSGAKYYRILLKI